MAEVETEEEPPHPEFRPRRWRDYVLLETVKAILRRKLLCVLAILAASGIAGGITMSMRPVYVASAKIYPPMVENPLNAFGLAGMTGLLGNVGMNAGKSTLFPLYEEVLYSRDLILQLLQTPLNDAGFMGTLEEYVQNPELEPALREAACIETVRGILSYDVDAKTAIATVGVRDFNPRVAALLVNRAVDLLNEFDVSASAAQAKEKRRFIEARLVEAEGSLGDAESRLETFRAENLRIGNAPHLLLEQARLQRELEIEQQVYLTLRKEAEMAQIEEQRSVPVINVLERAATPLYPAGPSWLKNAIMSAVLSTLFLFLFFAVRVMAPMRILAGLGLLHTRRYG